MHCSLLRVGVLRAVHRTQILLFVIHLNFAANTLMHYLLDKCKTTTLLKSILISMLTGTTTIYWGQFPFATVLRRITNCSSLWKERSWILRRGAMGILWEWIYVLEKGEVGRGRVCWWVMLQKLTAISIRLRNRFRGRKWRVCWFRISIQCWSTLVTMRRVIATTGGIGVPCPLAS